MNYDDYDYGLPFRDGVAFTDLYDEFDGKLIARGTFKRADDADLFLPTGVLVAYDALVSVAADSPFVRTVPPGHYPVSVALSCFTEGIFAGKALPAFMRVQFTDRPVARWEEALRPGDDPTNLTEEDDWFGHPVDAAWSGFVDQSALRYQDSLSDERSQAIRERFIAKIHANTNSEEGVSMVIDPSTGANVVACFSNNGYFPSYWGLDEHDVPVCIVTDFCVVH